MGGEPVVFFEVARRGIAGPESLLQSPRSVLGDILGERARGGAGSEDARDGLVLEGAERAGVAEGLVEVLALIALAQE